MGKFIVRLEMLNGEYAYADAFTYDYPAASEFSKNILKAYKHETREEAQTVANAANEDRQRYGQARRPFDVVEV